MSIDAELPAGVQTVAANTPLGYVIRLLKRDGGVFIKNFISEEDADKAYSECRERIDNDMVWEGNFFPSEYTALHCLFIRNTNRNQRRRNEHLG